MYRILLLAFFFITPALLAQVSTATLLGRVLDSSGAAAPAARITARNVATNLERSTTSDIDGSYQIPYLAAGAYQVMVELTNFNKEVRDGVVLATGDRIRLDWTLSPGRVTESVTVSAGLPLVNTVSPEMGVVIDPLKVTNLPLNGRNFTQLVTLQPGVQFSNVNGRNSYNFNGLTQWGLNITLDGTDASFGESASFGDPSGRSLLNTVSVDSIQEFRVLTGTFSAETGRASGGAVNVITRSGTNNFHGVLFEYFRNSALDARSFFARTKDPLRQNQFGGNLGGPIRKDRLFFFTSYEGARRRVGQQITSQVPSAAFRAKAPAATKPYLDLVPLPETPVDANSGIHRRSDTFQDSENLGNIKVDYNTAKTISSVRYNINDSENSIPNLIAANRQVFSIRSHLATISNVYTISPAALNEFRFGFNRWFIPRLNSTYFGGMGEILISGVLPTGNFEGFLRFVDNAYNWADNLSYRKGRHSLKAGVEIRRLQSNRIQKQNPIYNYNSADDFLANRPASVRIIFGQPGAGLRQTQTGLFLQDDFQVHPRVMLNLGVRYEYYTPVAEAVGRLFNVVSDPFGPFREKGAQIYDPDRNNFNPRVGLAWDVTGRQKTVVRAGFGLFSSPLVPIFIWDTPTIDPRQPFAFNATPQDIPGLAFPISGALAQAVKSPDDALKLGLVPAVVGRRIIDPKLRDTYSEQWNVSVQRQLSEDIALQAAYVGNLNAKAVNTRSVNLVNPATGQRQDPKWGEILIIENSGKRMYQGLQLSLTKRLKHGLLADAYYTWGHSIVYGGDDCCTGTNSRIQDFDNIAGSRGNANTDIRHALTINYSYELPLKNVWAGSGWNKLVRGWSVQGITRIQSGQAVTIFSGRDRRGNGVAGTQRVNYVGGSQYAADRNLANWFNKSAFALPPVGQFGNLGYATAWGPRSLTMDFSLTKNTPIWREQQIQFRAEFFNGLNHAVFGNPVSNFSSGTFGQILTAGPGRQIQFALRYQF